MGGFCLLVELARVGSVMKLDILYNLLYSNIICYHMLYSGASEGLVEVG